MWGPLLFWWSPCIIQNISSVVLNNFISQWLYRENRLKDNATTLCVSNSVASVKEKKKKKIVERRQRIQFLPFHLYTRRTFNGNSWEIRKFILTSSCRLTLREEKQKTTHYLVNVFQWDSFPVMLQKKKKKKIQLQNKSFIFLFLLR